MPLVLTLHRISIKPVQLTNFENRISRRVAAGGSTSVTAAYPLPGFLPVLHASLGTRRTRRRDDLLRRPCYQGRQTRLRCYRFAEALRLATRCYRSAFGRSAFGTHAFQPNRITGTASSKCWSKRPPPINRGFKDKESLAACPAAVTPRDIRNAKFADQREEVISKWSGPPWYGWAA